jgi:hypothetical protein
MKVDLLFKVLVCLCKFYKVNIFEYYERMALFNLNTEL